MVFSGTRGKPAGQRIGPVGKVRSECVVRPKDAPNAEARYGGRRRPKHCAEALRLMGDWRFFRLPSQTQLRGSTSCVNKRGKG